jgi:apolipoprotein N-acyltransferase
VPLARWVAAALSALFAFLAFPPAGLTWVAFVALVPLFWAAGIGSAGPGLSFRQRFLVALAGQWLFFFLLLHWILFLPSEELTIPGLMIPALLFMSGYLAAFFALATSLPRWIERRAGIPAAATIPVFWTLLDFARGRGILGFPWGSLGYALAPQPVALQLSAWTGFWGLTLWIVGVNALFASALRAWEEGRGRIAGLRAAAALLLVAGPLLLGARVLAGAPRPTADASGGLRIALLQANTSREIKWKEGFQGTVVDDLLERTRRAAALEPDLIVWPETSAPMVLFWDADLAGRVSRTVAELRRWTLVGTLDARLLGGGKFESYNAAVLYDPDGRPIRRYYKQRLVPFSEKMPLADRLPWVNVLNFGQSDFTPGRETSPLGAGGHRFSVLICFESIFPELSRRGVRLGAEYLVNVTNDFWFGRSAGPVQHAEMAILRAVENRTPLARCANSGISFFVDPYGRVLERTGLFVEAMPAARLAAGGGGSFYTRHGEWLVAALGILALWGLLAAATRGGLPRWPRKGQNRRHA